MRALCTGLLSITFVLGAAVPAAAHCQIPCGIFDDELRVQLIEEHITTIEKSMRQINELSKQSPVDFNQLVRWIDNKEQHAQEIQDIVAEYFLSQRIKTPAATEGEAWDAYLAQLATLHQITVAAMKAKQTTDAAPIESLRTLVATFRTAYFGDEGGNKP
jgi:nickel superoxide dismutase